jgi:hypothetical protein
MYLIFLLGIFNISIIHAQKDDFVYKGIVMDSTTMTPLPKVDIYRISDTDTLKIQSDAAGKFEITVSKAAKLHFRKLGYAWHTVRINDKNVQNIYLLPSKPHKEKNIGKENYDSVEMFYDGEFVPFELWDDVGSIHPDEIANLEFRSSKDGKSKLSFTSKR